MSEYKKLIDQLGRLATEQTNPNTLQIDRLSPLEVAEKINAEDQTVASTVKEALPALASAAELFAACLKAGGRVFYIGAGTSGRLGVLDAAECPPTFGTDPNLIKGLISGGYETLVQSREGVEDDEEAAVADLRSHHLSDKDFVVGIAASTRTPYTLAGVEYAAKLGCKTAFIACNRMDTKPESISVLIELPVGPEVITGSTRMKSGTAQKMALNIISTTAMVLMGKTLGNLMIDLQAKSEKLAARSRKILIDLLGISLEEAETLLDRAEGSVKLAVAMHHLQCDATSARASLAQYDGFLGRLLNNE